VVVDRVLCCCTSGLLAVVLLSPIGCFPHDEPQELTELAPEQHYQGRNLAEWVMLLRTGDLPARREAAHAVGRYGRAAQPALEDLIEAIRGGDSLLRLYAVRSVGQIGEGAQSAVPVLVHLLEEERKYRLGLDRTEVIRALGLIGPGAKSAIPILVQIMEQQPGKTFREEARLRIERMASAWALGEIGRANPEVISALRYAEQNDRDWHVRQYASESLEKITGQTQNQKVREKNLARGAVQVTFDIIRGYFETREDETCGETPRKEGGPQ